MNFFNSFQREKLNATFGNAIGIADGSYFLIGYGKKITFVSYFLKHEILKTNRFFLPICIFFTDVLKFCFLRVLMFLLLQ